MEEETNPEVRQPRIYREAFVINVAGRGLQPGRSQSTALDKRSKTAALQAEAQGEK